MSYPVRLIDPGLVKSVMSCYRTFREKGYSGPVIMYLLANRKVSIRDMIVEDDEFFNQTDKWDRTLQKSFMTMLLTELSFEDDNQEGYNVLIRWIGFYEKNAYDLTAELIRLGAEDRFLVHETDLV